MSDSNKVVQIKDYKVGITHQNDNLRLVLDTPYFSEINNYYCNIKKEGEPVKQHLTLNGLLERLNTIKHKLSKNNSISILKGLYQDGTSGVFCYESVPFLFFDIDIKKGENEHLLDSYANSKVFTKLLDIGVLVWRSDSGKGMAGVLYTPHLKDIKNIDRTKYLAIGNAITDYLTKTLKVNAKFDKAQNKFRQVRYLALQQEKINFT